MIAALSLLLLSAAPDLQSQVKELKLKNGMVWLVVERPQAPVFTGFVRVKVGGSDEEPGATGLAHLFEHMAFKGTPALGTTDFEAEKKLLAEIADVGDALAALERAGSGQGEAAKQLRAKLDGLQKKHSELTDENALAKLYQLNGAVGLNATTDKDLTSYFVSLPKNRLELWLNVEAQRLAAPVLRDFYTERDVVREERRMSIESNPGGAMFEELNHVAFVGSPYRWPTVGYDDDLKAMSLRTATDFHRRFYAPSNAVGCLVGDVKFEEVKVLIERTFGAIPARENPPGPVFSEPPSRAARRSTVYFDAAPRWFLAFRKPPPPARDDFTFDVVQILLGEGRTGRLHQRLVLKDRLAQGVGAFGSAPGSRFENLFVIAVTPMKGSSLEAIEKAVWDELEKLKTTPVPDAELEKVRNRTLVDSARSLESNGGIAGSLSMMQSLLGDWRYIFEQPKVVATLGAADVQALAQKYFKKESMVVIDLQRPEGSGGGK